MEKTMMKLAHVARNGFRRNVLLKIILGTVLTIWLLYLAVVSRSGKGLYSVYQFYGIAASGDEGLTASDPLVFHLNNRNITLTSGSIHYFRVHPHYWRDRLRKLRAMGAVAVQTYVPWNLHEPYKDIYDFGDGAFEMSPFLDIVRFIEIAKEEDLLVIFRPGPYICAEWDFGGLPSYLLKDGVKVRTTDPKYLDRVEKYFGRLLPLVTPLQVIYGGPIIMFQVENEYGALRSPQHEYMVWLKRLMDSHGVKGLYFTSDSPDPSLESGALPDLGVLQTANFKLDGILQMNTLRRLQPDRPIMVTEYWSGWFDHWDQPKHVTTDPQVYLDKLREILTFPASVNLYMFHGGTTFGFLNGANDDDREGSYHPDTSSYDYDAPLTEAGDYTVKYGATLELFRAAHPQLSHPPPPTTPARTLTLTVTPSHELPWTHITRQMPVPEGELRNCSKFVFMEDLPGRGQNYGFMWYQRGLRVEQRGARLRLTGRVRDLALVLVDSRRQTIVLDHGSQTDEFGFWASQEDELELKVEPGQYTLELLVENCGRLNYVKTLEWILQKKGLGPDNEMSIIGGQFTTGIDVTGMPFNAEWVASLSGWQPSVVVGEKTAPSLVKASFLLSEDQLSDTYLDIQGWRRGVVYVNGFNIGRYFSGGPQLTMYIPAPLLKVGENTIIIFELYVNSATVQLVTEPLFL